MYAPLKNALNFSAKADADKNCAFRQQNVLTDVDVKDNTRFLFFKKVFLPSTDAFSNFSRFQY